MPHSRQKRKENKEGLKTVQLSTVVVALWQNVLLCSLFTTGSILLCSSLLITFFLAK